MKRLLIRPGAIGDFIVSIPALECLRTEYLEIWCAAANVPLAARIATRARAISRTGLDLLELREPDPQLLAALRSFDSIISWYGTSRPEFRNAVAALGLPVHFFPALPAAGSAQHAADFYLDQARSLARCTSDGIPRIDCRIEPRNFAAIHPFAASKKKEWPLDRYQALAEWLKRRMPVEWCAGPEDDLPGARRFEDLYDLACWLAAAGIYIGNDSGPTHLAAAVGSPVVALFGPTDPGVWAPRGPNVEIIAESALDEITVGRLVSLLDKFPRASFWHRQ